MSGLKQLTQNLANILSDPTPILEAMANAVLADILEVAIDGQNTVKSAPMKRNKASTIKSKQRRGVSPADHPLWDSQTLRRKDSWIIRKLGRNIVLEPGSEIAGRSVYVQEDGYDYFGVSRTGEKAAAEAGGDVLQKLLEKGL